MYNSIRIIFNHLILIEFGNLVEFFKESLGESATHQKIHNYYLLGFLTNKVRDLKDNSNSIYKNEIIITKVY